MNWIKKPWVQNAALIAGGLLAGLVVAEIAVRLLVPASHEPADRDIRIPDPAVGYRLVPHAPVGHGLVIDEQGFNNESVPTHADIVALGDSMTFGENGTVSENWPQDLGRLMGLSVYNMGVGGYGPVQYYALADRALALKPKYLVVGLLLGNDFFDAYNMVYNGHLLDKADYEYRGIPYETDYWKALRSPSFANDERQVATEFNHQQNVPLQSLRTWIRAHSALYDFLANRTYFFREFLGLSKPFWLGTTDWKQTDPDITLRYESTTTPAINTIFWEGRTKLGLDRTNKNLLEGMRITKDLLLRIKRKADAAGAKLVIVVMSDKAVAYAPILGDKIQDNPDYVENLANELALRDETLAFCRTNGIACVDILPDLTAALKEGKALYPKTWDGHPVPLGYQVFAESVAKTLKKP